MCSNTHIFVFVLNVKFIGSNSEKQKALILGNILTNIVQKYTEIRMLSLNINKT